MFIVHCAHLARHLLADLLREELGHQPVHLLAHLLGLEVAHLLGRVDADVHGGVVALGRPRHELAVVRRARLERQPLTRGVGQLLVHGPRNIFHEYTKIFA